MRCNHEPVDADTDDLCDHAGADGHPGATYGADQIAAIGELAELELLTKTEIAKAVTAGTTEHTNADITAHPDLIEGHGAVDFQIGC